jgi:hypothetical protein
MQTVLTQQELNNIYDDDLLGRINGIFNNCSPMEQQILLKILEELDITGESET